MENFRELMSGKRKLQIFLLHRQCFCRIILCEIDQLTDLYNLGNVFNLKICIKTICYENIFILV